ncbi:MAG: hypothetical protein AB1564_17705 [Chloroflexota bacterium]
MPTPFEIYLSKVESDLRGGKATEHAYLPLLVVLRKTIRLMKEIDNSMVKWPME